MADSEVWTTEDIDDIDSVIQLKPHQKDVEFTTVTKTSDGDLVSIDELYEKTGQESIDKIIEGFNSLITRNKLKKEHGLLLRVEGAESWMELPDRMNAVKGGENFLKNIAQTFVDIIMAIVNFIKGICNWIWARLKSLFGFTKTEEEVKFLCEKTEEFKNDTAKVFGAIGITGFNPDELVKELPSNMMPSEMLSITKSKFEEDGDVAKKYDKAKELADEADALIKTNLLNAKTAGIENAKIINHIRKLISNNQMTTFRDIVPIKGAFAELGKKYLDPNPLIDKLKELAEVFYGIEPSKLGMDNHINTIKERLKNEVETVKIKYNKELYEETIKLVEKFNRSTNPKYSQKFGEDGINHLRKLIDKKDATLIDQLAKNVGDNSIYLVYLEFSNSAKQFSQVVESLVSLVQEVQKTIIGIIKLHTKTKAIVVALAANDLNNLTKAIDKLDPEERKNWENANPNTKIFHFTALNEQFLKEHPNGHLEKQASDTIGRFLTTQKGKGVMRSFGNYVEGLKR